MEFGLQLNGKDLKELRDLAQAADQLGFDALLLPDHVVYEQMGGAYDPHLLSWDQMIALAVVFEATRKIRAGHLVLCNLFRHPVITAQSLITLDHLSGGRLIAGLGAGWTETEFRMTGIAFPPIAARLRMLDESLTCIRSLWTREQTTFDGEFYKLKDAILWPKPVQRPHPPILLGGGGRGLLRIAGKHAATINIIPEVGKAGRISMENVAKTTDAVFQEKIRFVREEASKNGRKPESIQISTMIAVVILTSSPKEADSMAAMVAQGMGMKAEQLRSSPMALVGTPEQCTAELSRRCKQWGVSQFIFSGALDLKVMELLAKEVIPHVGK
jgi:probable F420-dependent oxidoreductase